MIIGHNFFNHDLDGCIWDTAICTDMLDEAILHEGTYDELFIDLDTKISNHTAQPSHWQLTTIVDAKFRGNLDGGSIGADGFKITDILLYRSIVGTEKWSPIAQFKYDSEYNMYDYVDRYVQNGVTYQYGICPVANEIIGDTLRSDEIAVKYEGMFLTNKNENRKFKYDVSLGDVQYNTSSATIQPINGKYPMVVFGNMNYRSGNISVLPLAKSTEEAMGNSINGLDEQVNRQKWLDLINNGRAKILRMDSGVLMLIKTDGASLSHKEGRLTDLASVSFNYTEVGDIRFDTLVRNDLIPSVYLSKMTFDEDGGIIYG